MDKISKKTEFYGNDLAIETYSDKSKSQEDQYIEGESSKKLNEKMNRLTDSQRNALNLFYFEVNS